MKKYIKRITSLVLVTLLLCVCFITFAEDNDPAIKKTAPPPPPEPPVIIEIL